MAWSDMEHGKKFEIKLAIFVIVLFILCIVTCVNVGTVRGVAWGVVLFLVGISGYIWVPS